MFENKSQNISFLLCFILIGFCFVTKCNLEDAPIIIDPPVQDSICVVLDPIDIGINIDSLQDVDNATEDINNIRGDLNIILLDNITRDEQAEVIGCINKNIDAANDTFNTAYNIEQFWLDGYTVQTAPDNYSVEELMVLQDPLDNLSPLFDNSKINIIVTHNSADHREIYNIQSVILGFVFNPDLRTINDNFYNNVMVLSMDAMRKAMTFIHEIGHMLGLLHCCDADWNKDVCNIMISANWPCASEFTEEQVQIMRKYVAARNVFDIGLENRVSVEHTR